MNPLDATARPGDVADTVACGRRTARKRRKRVAARDVDYGEEAMWRELGLDDPSDEESDGEDAPAAGGASDGGEEGLSRERTEKKEMKRGRDSHGRGTDERRWSSRERRAPQLFVPSQSERGSSERDADAGDGDGKRRTSSREKCHRSKITAPSKAKERASTLPKKSGAGKSNKKRGRKPLFDPGEKVYAAWWSDAERNTAPSWYPGVIRDYEEADANGPRVPNGTYTVAFDDGDVLDGLEDIHIKTEEEFLLEMKKELKPLFDEGDEVFTAWWPDDLRTASTPSWYPGRIKSYKEVKNDDSEYGPTRFYNVQFDDGDEGNEIEDAYIFNKEDYLLAMRSEKAGNGGKWKGVKNVVDEKSSDLWANLVGYYTALLDGVEHQFSLLSDALRAYDAHVMSCPELKPKKSHLNLPEEWDFSKKISIFQQSEPRKNQGKKSETRTSPRINAARDLYKAPMKHLLLEKEDPVVAVQYDRKTRHGDTFSSEDTIKGFTEGENGSTDQEADEEASIDPVARRSPRISAATQGTTHGKCCQDGNPSSTRTSSVADGGSVTLTPKKRRSADGISSNPIKGFTEGESLIMDQKVGEKTDAEPAPESTSTLSSPISTENVSLLVELAYQSITNGGVKQSDTNMGCLLTQSNNILKEALEMYASRQKKNHARIPKIEMKKELLEEYKESLFSLHGITPKDEKNTRPKDQKLSQDHLVSSNAVCHDDATVASAGDPSCDDMEKETSNELHDYEKRSSPMNENVSFNAEENENNPAIVSNSNPVHIATKSLEGPESNRRVRADKSSGEIIVRVTLLNTQVGNEMIAIISGKSGKNEPSKVEVERRSTPIPPNALHKPQEKETARRLPLREGRGKISRLADEIESGPSLNQKSPTKRKQENRGSNNDNNTNVGKDDDAATKSVQDNSIGANGNKLIEVKALVSGIQIGRVMPAVISVDGTSCASAKPGGLKKPGESLPTDSGRENAKQEKDSGVSLESMSDQPPSKLPASTLPIGMPSNVSQKDLAKLSIQNESFKPTVSIAQLNQSHESLTKHKEQQSSLQHQMGCMDALANACVDAAEEEAFVDAAEEEAMKFVDSMDSPPIANMDPSKARDVATEESRCLPSNHVQTNAVVNSNAIGAIWPSGLNHFFEASKFHCFNSQQMMLMQQQQPWPNMAHPMMPDYGQIHTYFNIPQPMPQSQCHPPQQMLIQPHQQAWPIMTNPVMQGCGQIQTDFAMPQPMPQFQLHQHAMRNDMLPSWPPGMGSGVDVDNGNTTTNERKL